MSSRSQEENEIRENRLREYLSNSLFNHGLPRPVGSNTCYINSVFMALRCLFNMFRLLIDARIYAYFAEFWNDSDPLWNFHSLITSMSRDVNKISRTTVNRRQKFINALQAHSDQARNRNQDRNPIPHGNAQGDPMELILFLKDWLVSSIESIRRMRASLLPPNRNERAICDQALIVGNQLERVLTVDMMPIVSDWNRCPRGHVSRRSERTFISLPIAREYRSIRSSLLDYFAEEEFEKRCEQCGNLQCMARRGNRLEEFPEKILAIGLAYNGILNSQTGQVQQIGINWVPNIEEYINLEEFYTANEGIYGVRQGQLQDRFNYRLRSLIIRHGRDVNNSHYTTLCLNLQSNNWQWFNDDRVVEVDMDIRDFLISTQCHGYPVGLFYERTTIVPNDPITRIISTELSRMSIDNPGNSEVIDWEAEFERDNDVTIMNETFATNEDCNVTITNETVETNEESNDLDLSINRNENLDENEENSDETTVSTATLSSRPGDKKRRKKKKQSWKARKQSNAESMRRLRQEKEYAEKEKKQREDRLRSKEGQTILEGKRQYMANYRSDEIRKRLEQERNTEEHRERRLDEEYRRNEQVRNTDEHRERRQDDEYRRSEQGRNTEEHRERRLDEEYRRNEQQRNTVEHRVRRKDDEYRRSEQGRNTDGHRVRRLDEEFRQREREADRIRRTLANNSEKAIVERYNAGIKEGTDYVCVSCGGLYFMRTMTEFKEEDFRANLGQASIATLLASLSQVQIRTDGKLWICITCLEYVRLRQELPTLCLANNLKLPVVQPSICALNDTEERLCSPRIAFIRIMPLKWDRQKGLRGNVVNVPVDVMDTVRVLPRAFSATETIQVNFMRRMNYNQAYLSDLVRPSKVIRALHDLAQSDLFVKLGIEIDDDYIRDHSSSREVQEYIVDQSEARTHNRIEEIDDDDDDDDDADLGVIHRAQKLYEDDEDDCDPNQQILPTMLMDDDERAGNEAAISIAPGQHAIPVSYMHDEYAEEATFLKIFGGNLVIGNIDQRVTLQGRCKSFFRSYDRRCATSVPYIFYMYRKLMSQKLLSAINISLKKSTVREKITAQDALNSSRLIERMNDDEYQRFMSTIRSSPEYWTVKKKQMFAMIRQLGCPVFFITLSPAEIDWPELIILLHRLYEPDEAKKHITVDDVARMSRQAKIDLVSRDPVTTARYFENRIRHLINFMFHKEGPFKEDPIVDYFWRIEFQSRGSPHVHMLVWMKNRPTYIVGTPLNSPENEAILDLVDKYITCESPESSTATLIPDSQSNENDEVRKELDEYQELERFIKYQVHVHKSNCLVDSWPSRINAYAFDKESNNNRGEQNDNDDNDEESSRLHKFCKYGFPWPILDRTLILDPLVDARGKIFATGAQNSVELNEMVDRARENFFRIKRELDRMAREQARHRKNKTKYPTKTFGEFLDELELTFDEYVLALRSSINTPTIFLKRTCHEIMINPYNKTIFLKHQANMDIQFVLNSYGVAVYLTSYLMKSHALMNRVLRVAQVELRNNRNMSLKQKLVQIASKFQNCSEISAQECVYHLLSMPVSYSSREHTFIITFKESERFSMLKPTKYLRIMVDSDTNVYMTSIQEKYAARPNELEYTCLAEFTAGYNYISAQQMKQKLKGARLPQIVEDEDELDDDEFEQMNSAIELENVEGSNNNTQQSIGSASSQFSGQRERNENNSSGDVATAQKTFKLRNGKGFVERREKLKIIRYRRYNVDTSPDDYYREQLMLFKPWRSEKDEVEVREPFEEFKKHSEVIALNRRKFEYLLRNETEAEALERMENEIENQEDLNYAQLAAEQNRIDDILMGRRHIPIDPNLNQEEIMDELERERELMIERYEEETGFHAENENVPNAATVRVQGVLNDKDTRARRRMDDDAYRHFMNRLNRKQHTFMINCLNKIKRGENFQELVVGESGTGKSNLIKAIDQCVDRYLRKQDNNEPEKERVILCSFTGKASFNIGGVTLHSTFRLPVKTNEITPICLNTADELRKSMRKLRLIIMDEVSMIGCTLFNWVNLRLQQVFQNSLPFGGVSVILFGDFNQLHPVMDSWIFQDKVLNNQYRDLVSGAATSLWSLFKIFRLDEIMRQAGDKRFAEALTTLGRLGLCGLNNDEVALFNSRIVEDPERDIPEDAIFLYHTNEKKNAMCERRLRSRPGETFENRAKHVARGEGKDYQAAVQYIKVYAMASTIQEKTGLANNLLLKEGVQYMILVNQDVSDGLVNGTTGTLRVIEKYRDMDDLTNASRDGVLRAQYLWMEFSDESVGAKLRTKYAALYNQPHRNIPANWTPLYPQRVTYRANASCKWSIERIQFAIEIAEAITIDKAQGQTYPRVAFDLIQTTKVGHNSLTRAHLYVALSRVRRLEDLYLFNGSSINENKDHQNWSEEKRRQQAERKVAKDAQVIELKRMQAESAFVNRFPFTELAYVEPPPSPNNNSMRRLSICMHNVANLRFHMDSIKADFGMMNADVLICVETATKTCERSVLPYQSAGTDDYYGEYKIDGFSLMRMGSSRFQGAKTGCALYFSNRALRHYNLEFLVDSSPNGDGVYFGNRICELAMFSCSVKRTSAHHQSQQSQSSQDEFVVIYGYNHPNRTIKDFYKDLKKFMTEHDLYARPSASANHQHKNRKTVYLIGDFNLNLFDVPLLQANSQDKVHIDKMRTKLGLEFKWPVDQNSDGNQTNWHAYESTDRRTCIDWCMSRENRSGSQLKTQSQLTVYENWFSDHKPLWLEVNLVNTN